MCLVIVVYFGLFSQDSMVVNLAIDGKRYAPVIFDDRLCATVYQGVGYDAIGGERGRGYQFRRYLDARGRGLEQLANLQVSGLLYILVLFAIQFPPISRSDHTVRNSAI
jgi:hypothetical protein